MFLAMTKHPHNRRILTIYMFKKNELAFSRVVQVKWLVFKCFES